MCEPVTLTALTVGALSAGGAAAAGLTVAGLSVGATALTAGVLAAGITSSAMGAYNQSRAAKDQYKYQSAVARNNAKMAEYAAQDASNRGAQEAAKVMAEARRVRSRQTVALASNGIDISSGSAANMLDDTDLLAAQDAATIRTNAARQAWGYRVEGSNYNASADMYRTAARNENPNAALGSSLLNSAASVVTSFSGAKLGGGAPSAPSAADASLGLRSAQRST